MKINHLYLWLCLAGGLLMTACTDPSEEDSAAENSVVVNFCVSSMSRTRATTVADTDVESKISTLAFYLVDLPDKSSVTQLTLDETGTATPSYQWDSTTGQAVIMLPSSGSQWLLYAVVNAPSGLTLATSSYSAFIGSYTLSTPSDAWQNNHFLMCNKQKELSTSSDYMGGGVLLSRSSKTASIEVERVAAKVNPTLSTDFECAPIGLSLEGEEGKQKISQMEILDYALVNCVNTFNLVQQWKAGTATGEKVVEGPSSSTGYSLSTGYYNTLGTSSTLSYTALGTPLYCLENNSPLFADLVTDGKVTGNDDAVAGTRTKGRTTALIFRARAILVDGKSFTEGIGDHEGPYGWDDPVASSPTRSLTPGIGEAFKTFYSYKGRYYADLQTLKARNSELSSCSDVASLRTAGVSVYEDGYIYYTYYLEDTNYTDGGYTFFNVARNTQYNVVVKRIVGLGDDVPGGSSWNADAPITVNGPLLSVSVNVSDWTAKNADYVVQ